MWTPADNPPPAIHTRFPGFSYSDDVLVTDGKIVGVGFWSDDARFGNGWTADREFSAVTGPITHWHPLPPLPGQEPERLPDDDRDVPPEPEGTRYA